MDIKRRYSVDMEKVKLLVGAVEKNSLKGYAPCHAGVIDNIKEAKNIRSISDSVSDFVENMRLQRAIA